MTAHDHTGPFLDDMRAAGTCTPRELSADGKIHRFPADVERKAKGASWCVLNPHGFEAFGNWRLGIKQTWRHDGGGKSLTAEEHAQLEAAIAKNKAVAAAERELAQEAASLAAVDRWAQPQGVDPGHRGVAVGQQHRLEGELRHQRHGHGCRCFHRQCVNRHVGRSLWRCRLLREPLGAQRRHAGGNRHALDCLWLMTALADVAGGSDGTLYVGGDHLEFVVAVTDAAGAPANLTGAMAIKYVITRQGSGGQPSGPALVSKTLGSGIAVTDAAGGIFTVTLEDGVTGSLAGSYRHEAEVTDVEGRISTVFVGTYVVTARDLAERLTSKPDRRIGALPA